VSTEALADPRLDTTPSAQLKAGGGDRRHLGDASRTLPVGYGRSLWMTTVKLALTTQCVVTCPSFSFPSAKDGTVLFPAPSTGEGMDPSKSMGEGRREAHSLGTSSIGHTSNWKGRVLNNGAYS
jgi:hypothetical protein